VSTHRLIVYTDPIPGREAEYNEWYDEVHLKEVLSVEGFVGAQRFALADAQIAGMADAAPCRYLAIYEIEAESAKDALDKLQAASATMNISDALDSARSAALAFTSIGEHQSGS